MPVSAQTSKDGSTMTISITDRFDFNVHKDLRNAYESRSTACNKYVFDLRNTSYMDSSALGMLLQLREFAGGNNHVIRITNADSNIRDILRIANFDKLMKVD